jgi:hypothetical protein
LFALLNLAFCGRELSIQTPEQLCTPGSNPHSKEYDILSRNFESNYDQVKFGADNSTVRRNGNSTHEKSQTELNEITHLLSHLRPGHILKSIASRKVRRQGSD